MAYRRLVVLVSHGIPSLTWNEPPCGTLAPRPIAFFANKCQLREEPSFKYILQHVNQLWYNIGYCYSHTGCFIISSPNLVLVGLCGAVQAFRARPFVLWLQFWLMNSKASAAWRDWKLKSISVHSVLSWLSRYQRWQTLQIAIIKPSQILVFTVTYIIIQWYLQRKPYNYYKNRNDMMRWYDIISKISF